MRSIPLLTVDMMLPGPGGQARTARFDYRETIREVLLSATPGRGISTAEAMKGFEVWLRIAEQRGNQAALLEEADFAVLKARLEAFSWGYFTEECAAFVQAIRDAPAVQVGQPPPTDALAGRRAA